MHIICGLGAVLIFAWICMRFPGAIYYVLFAPLASVPVAGIIWMVLACFLGALMLNWPVLLMTYILTYVGFILSGAFMKEIRR